MKEKITILVVDDEADFRELMTAWLVSKGYAVISAAGGDDAISIVKEKDVDIMLLDLRMPVLDGVETLRRIREFNKRLPVIVVSAYVTELKPGEALAYGISGVFYKEKNFEGVLPLLESALKTHKRLKK